jgi:hypothetical protein
MHVADAVFDALVVQDVHVLLAGRDHPAAAACPGPLCDRLMVGPRGRVLDHPAMVRIHGMFDGFGLGNDWTVSIPWLRRTNDDGLLRRGLGVALLELVFPLAP